MEALKKTKKINQAWRTTAPPRRPRSCRHDRRLSSHAPRPDRPLHPRLVPVAHGGSHRAQLLSLMSRQHMTTSGATNKAVTKPASRLSFMANLTMFVYVLYRLQMQAFLVLRSGMLLRVLSAG